MQEDVTLENVPEEGEEALLDESIEIAEEVPAEEPDGFVDDWELALGRDVAALQDPRPTIIVASTGIRKTLGFATIIWAMPVSHDPAMVAFALRPTSATMECIQMSGYFSLNILPATKQALDLAQVVGTRTGRNMNKGPLVPHHMVHVAFDKEETRRVEARRASFLRKAQYQDVTETVSIEGKVPVVDIASSWLICAVDHMEPVGDHLLVVGNVLQARTKAPRNEKGHLEPTDVLLCVQHDNFGKVEPLEKKPKPKAPGMKPPAPPKA